MKTITKYNFELYAAHHYENTNCVSSEEFYEDLKRIKYIRRLFNRFRKTGELKDRLILNHLVILYNVFQRDACTKILVFSLPNDLDYLKPFLQFLNYWPDLITGVEEKVVINTETIEASEHITKVLQRKFTNV